MLWLVGPALGLLLALGGLLAWQGGEVTPRFAAVPRLELPLPPPAAAVATTAAASAAAAAAAPAGEVALDPRLSEAGRFGALPRLGPAGERPLLAYAAPAPADDPRPKVALLVLGLGLQEQLSEAAVALPPQVSLAFSPYAESLPARVERARRAGHEIFLELPMQPPDFPASDPGPRTLRADLAPAENAEHLWWVLGRAAGYVGVAGSGARFAASAEAAPVLRELAGRGLALVEVGGADLHAGAAAAGLPYAAASGPIDQEPAPLAIDYGLAGLEAEALERGSALGAVQLYPVTLERLGAWLATLEDKGLALVPASTLLIERAGLAAGPRGDAGRSLAARG